MRKNAPYQCPVCDQEITQEREGNTRKYCSYRCRIKARDAKRVRVRNRTEYMRKYQAARRAKLKALKAEGVDKAP